MQFLCPQHLFKIKQDSLFAQETWRNMMKSGYIAHSQQQFQKAARHFGAACQVACTILEKPSGSLYRHTLRDNTVTMLVKAFQNMAVSYCAEKNYGEAESVLSQVHDQLLSLLLNPDTERRIKIDALSYLDKTLFTLTAILGSLGRTAEVHEVIELTEGIAETAAQQLFH